MLHHNWFYKKAHRVHHLSTNPSPFASQAFHPIEACFELFWIIPIVFIIPFCSKILIAEKEAFTDKTYLSIDFSGILKIQVPKTEKIINDFTTRIAVY
jgi:hypothetical protein